jgi:hypothetical protein
LKNDLTRFALTTAQGSSFGLKPFATASAIASPKPRKSRDGFSTAPPGRQRDHVQDGDKPSGTSVKIQPGANGTAPRFPILDVTSIIFSSDSFRANVRGTGAKNPREKSHA